MKGRDNATALWWAISAREPEAAWSLLSHGCSANTKNNKGISAIYLAVERLDPKCVGVLIEKGAKYGEQLILEAVLLLLLLLLY